MKKILMAICFIMLSLSSVQAMDDAKLLMGQASQAYQNGQFKQSVELYKQVLEVHPGQWEVMYNLGNSYARMKEYGEAILYYERARKIQPRDKDLNDNLAFIQGMIKFKVEDKRNWYVKQWLWLVEQVSFYELLLGALTLYLVWLLLSILGLKIRNPKIQRIVEIKTLILILLILFLLPLGTKAYKESYYKEAIINQPESEVRYGPSLQDKVAFRLVEGLRVSVKKEHSEWLQVQIESGEQGWIEKKDLELI